jgi:hypothetical protein
MGALSRRKGARYEIEVCEDIWTQLSLRVRRRLGQERDSGHDIELPTVRSGVWRLECKRRARIGGIREWLDQARAGMKDKDCAAVVMRADGWPGSLVVLDLEDFLRLIAEELEFTPEDKA